MSDCPGCNPAPRCPLGGPPGCTQCESPPVRTCTLNRTRDCGCESVHVRPGTVETLLCAEHEKEALGV